MIAIQETWEIKNVNSLTLPSFHEFIYKTRSSSRGGGVGFYIKRDLKFKIIEDFSIFNERIFESLCVEVEFSKNNSALFIDCNDPDVAFFKFWDIFSTFFDLSFPSRKVSFNKNYHKIYKFMTAGLLISRRRKLELYKTYLACRTELNFAVYKKYMNLFNRLIRASKVSYYESQLERS